MQVETESNKAAAFWGKTIGSTASVHSQLEHLAEQTVK